jgi:hypothetical protein
MTTRTPAGGRAGISPVTLVVFVILAIIAAIIAFGMYTGTVTRKAELDKITAESAALDRQIQAVVAETGEVRNFLESKRDADAVKAYFNEMDMKGIQATPRNFRKINIDLDLWIMRLNLLIGELDKRIGEATTQAESAETSRDATRDDYARRVQQKNAEFERLDQFLTAELAKKENLVTTYAKEKQEFINKFNNTRDKWEARKKDLLYKTEQMTRTNAVLRRGLLVLRPEPTMAPPSGRILRSDWQTKKVVIDLGEKDHAFPGLDFDVYFIDKDGTRVVKGKVELREVLPDTSIALVIESDPHYPIVAGDAIQTSFLPIPRKQKFVIAGFIPPGAAYTKSQMEALIRLNGGEVQPTVDLYTDVLILGETAPTGLAEMDKKVIGEAQSEAEKGRTEVEFAREISVNVVDYREFLQSIQR